jgi:branched-chain amino acid transport system ATP-binding protein
MALLRLEDVHVNYGAVVALEQVSLRAEPASVTVILGANGAGKSSLIGTVMGLVRHSSGEIWLDDVRLDDLAPAARVSHGIGLSPEGRRVFTDMTVAENLRVGGFNVGKKDRREQQELVYGYFPVLAERQSQLAGTLSGGEQQMLAIGRALMTKPRLLLLDEPSLGLAPLIVEEIARIIGRLASEESLTVLLSEQNASLGLDIATSGYVLQSGSVRTSGDAESLRTDDAVTEAYLGA